MIVEMIVMMRSVPGHRRAGIARWVSCILAAAGLMALDLARPAEKQWAAHGAMAAIRFYQRDLHPLTARFTKCRLEPTCSRFAMHRLETQGLFGTIAIMQRLIRCSRTRRPADAAVQLHPALFLQARPPDLDQGCAACLATTGGLLLLVVGWIAGGIALLVWVARDAKNRSVESPILWMLLVLFTSFVGLLIYLLARPGGNLVSCEHCRNRKLQYARLCPHCGNQDPRSGTAHSLGAGTAADNSESRNREAGGAAAAPPAAEARALYCSQCGAKQQPSSRFCENCGVPL